MHPLLKQLTEQLDITPAQAKSGAGLVFKMAQEHLGEDFSKVESAVDRIHELMDAAPEEGAASSFFGGLAGALGGDKLGDLSRLIAGFKKLDIDPDKLEAFGRVILGYLSENGADDLVERIRNTFTPEQP